MIIWGSTGKVTTVGGGQFFCPVCKRQAHYSVERVSRYFTFFFIPLFPIRTIGEYVRCGNCHAELRSEVLRFTREQIEQATAPWECPACGNRNSPAESACLSCGAGRQAGPPPLPGQAGPNAGAGRSGPPPPPPPGASGLDPAAVLTSPPPLAGAQVGRYSSIVPRVILIVVGVFVCGFIGLIALAIFHAPKSGQANLADRAGREEFEAASKTIGSDRDGVAHGNTPEAEKLAGRVAEILDAAGKKIPHMDDTDSLDSTHGKFLVFCQLNKDSCAFLIHVPNLRRYSSDSKQAIAKLCYVTARTVLKSSGNDASLRKVAVATRGALLYDTGLAGSYLASQDDVALDALDKLSAEGSDVPDLYPFFSAEAETDVTATTTPIASLPPSSSTPNAPAAPVVPDGGGSSSSPGMAKRPAPESRPPPSWVPIYPDLAKPPRGTGREENGVLKGRANFDTSDPLDKVQEFYETKLKSDGFAVTTNKPAGRIFEKAEVAGQKDGGKQTLRAEITQMKARTVVTLIYEGPENAEAAPGKAP